ncbi:hypothetical protein CCR75_008766 [Bremia lactucae]|uniref:ABC transporter domain-containing protein n=1 Tax=Bremia lactucae TaxID=4779 RepID=A0A976FMA2_BRELC|nr:hypothetical protein CCR75_008766 [Bremia lactucae]
MARLWSSVGVLLWKHWRELQHESRLNRNRVGKRWLFPALVTTIIIPLGLILVLIQKMCEYNAMLVKPNGGLASLPGFERALSSGSNDTSSVSNDAEYTEHAPFLLTALPLLLAKSNQSLAFLHRDDGLLFLQYLNSQYPGSAELGIPSYVNMTKIIPFSPTASNEAADAIIQEYPTTSGENIYATFDLRRADNDPKKASPPLEFSTFFYRKGIMDPSKQDSNDQLFEYYSKEWSFHRPLVFPDILPFQMAMNLLVRLNTTTFRTSRLLPLTSLSAETTCHVLDNMLSAGNLRWKDLAATSPLGHTMKSCTKAVANATLSFEVERFLSNLVTLAISMDKLNTLAVTPLPNRPATTIHGPLESNIVYFFAYLFLWPYALLIRSVVNEKEKQLKEYLLIMGLPVMALLISWFLLYFIASVIVAGIGTWLLCGTVFIATIDGVLCFFLLLVLFITSLLLFGVAITPIFNQTKTAATCAPLIFFILSAGSFIQSLVGPDVAASSEVLTFLVDVLNAISSPVVFMVTMHQILAFDAVTLAIRPLTYAAVAKPMYQLVLQCLGYSIFGWYLEHVLPRTYGIQYKWNFFLHVSYWKPERIKTYSLQDDEQDESMPLTHENDHALDDTLREETLSEYLQHHRPMLWVQHLSKTYPNGKVALSNVSFGVQKGEIFGLLGPNGAGKSTTLSILCGMVPPTSGDAYVRGASSVGTNPRAIRQSLSVCFQQNLLFDNLTVWEHLWVVCALKATMGVVTTAESTWNSRLEQFRLHEKRNALAKTLSGGQKRKLSLVLALLDSSRVLLLDEPTAGMDLKSRVDTWDALKKVVAHRAVILTTHSMHEAQVLCENIGIVADGKLKCCGSSLFLQKHFGVGYKLTVVHPDGQLKDPRSSKQDASLLRILQTFVPDATIVSSNKWETRIQLPQGEERHFAELFRALEAMKQAFTIKRYAIAATNLEDVFVRVTEGEDVYNHVQDVREIDPMAENDMKHIKSDANHLRNHLEAHKSIRWTQFSPQKRLMSQLGALLLKRFKVTIRDKKLLFAQYIWPLAFFAIIMAVLQHILDATGVTETITALKPSNKDTMVYIASPSFLTASVADLVAQFTVDTHRIVVNTNITTATAMIEEIIALKATTFAAAFFVSHINYTANNALMAPVFTYDLYYNDTLKHSLPVSLQWMSQAYCQARQMHENAMPYFPCTLIVKRGSLPLTKALGTAITTDGNQGWAVDPDEAASVMRRIMVAFYLLMAMNSVTGSYVGPIVRERANGLKRMQYQHLTTSFVSSVYWLANFIFDFLLYLMAVMVLIGILLLFSGCLTVEIIVAWFVSLVLFGVAILPAEYLSSLVFASQSSAQSYMMYASIFQIMAASAVFALSMIPGVCVKVHLVSSIMQVLPLFALSLVTLNAATPSWGPMRYQCLTLGSDVEKIDAMALLKGFLELPPVSMWSWDVTGRTWAFLLGSSVVYTCLLLVMDQVQMYPTVVHRQVHQWFQRCRPSRPFGYMEADQTMAMDEDHTRAIIRINHLSKIFHPRPKTMIETNSLTPPTTMESGQVIALNDVHFSIEMQDCVALLGVNGSGKSTLFEILTAGIAPTQGQAFIDSWDATNQPREASACYGYCAQGNQYFDDFSVREHLEFFYRLGGEEKLETTVLTDLIRRLDLIPVETMAAKHLSGGNQRRLMLALALLSERSSLLLLDEPSAGVDVVARRLMWRVLHEKRQSANRTSCLFTTHSMEEAEAVCANAVVLLQGNVVWSGSIPDLKQRVSRGMAICIRLESTDICTFEAIQEYTDLIKQSFIHSNESESLLLRDLEAVWAFCHQYLHSTKDNGSLATSTPLHVLTWLETLRGRFEMEKMDQEGMASISIREFVREWLLQEAFVRLEIELWQNNVTSRSGEAVLVADLETARGSGNNSSRVYETSCTETFKLADVFALLEEKKQEFHIAQYSVSELSLERVFEHFSSS